MEHRVDPLAPKGGKENERELVGCRQQKLQGLLLAHDGELLQVRDAK